MKLTAKPIIARFGFRATLTADALIAGLFIAAIGLVGPTTPIAVLMGILLVGGFFRSLEFTAINVVAFSDVTEAEMSRATAFSSMMQQLSLSGGVAFGALTLHLLGAGETRPEAYAFSLALGLVGLISCLSALSFARLPADAGRTMLSGPAAEPE